MKKEFLIVNNDGTPPRAERFYNLSVHSSLFGIPTATMDAFTGMNASIRSNYKEHGGNYEEHLIKSKKAILTTAERAISRAPDGIKKKALILGAGSCLDIPLAELADRFDEVTLLEVDFNSTETAVRNLTLERQRKIKIIAADATGIMGEFAGNIQRATASPLPDFLRIGAKIVHNTDPKEKAPDIGHDYTFVSSQLVMSQLAGIPMEFVRSVFRSRYQRELSNTPGGLDHDLLMNFQQLSFELHQEHIRHLARLVAPEGTVHFADTYAKLLPIPFSDQFQALPMVATGIIDPVIAEHFDVVPQEPDFWLWNNNPGQSQYGIISQSLDPKQKSPMSGEIS